MTLSTRPITLFTRPGTNPAPRTAYVNARLFDPESGLDSRGALLTEGDRILDLGANLFADGAPEGIRVVDCEGHLLCPGLVDLQVHFREPGQEHKETIESGSMAAVAGGVTSVVCQPNTMPRLDNVPVVEFVNKQAREKGFCHVRAYGAVSKGLEGKELTEMGLLVEAGIVGFTDDGLPVANSQLMRRAMEYARMLGVPIAQHAEDPQLSGDGCMNEGAVATQLGLAGIPNASEAVIVARDILLNQMTGGHYHVLHVSTAEALDLVRQAKARGQNVTCEVAPHHFTLSDEAVLGFNTNAKMNPPLRSEADRQALIEGLRDGTVDAIATDHAPHDIESKALPMASAAFGIVGLETMLPLSLALMQDGLTLRQLLSCMTWRAADIIGEKTGRLQVGWRADLALVDLEHRWIIDPAQFHSKSHNSPFGGRGVKGRAIRTVVNGHTVYELREYK